MPIPESQLETWSRQGAGVTAKNTHEAIRRALAADEDSRLRDADFEVYLQGSYRNDTNTRGDSDVDVVAQLNSTFVSNTAELSFGEQSRYLRWPQPLEQIHSASVALRTYPANTTKLHFFQHSRVGRIGPSWAHSQADCMLVVRSVTVALRRPPLVRA
jgi:hypothetical protein